MKLFYSMDFFSFSGIWLVFSGIFNLADGGKLLVVPMDGSHWLSMRHVVQRVAQKGHQVVMVMPESSLSIHGSELYTVKTYTVLDENKNMKAHWEMFGKKHFADPPFLGSAYTTLKDILVIASLFLKICESMLSDEKLLSYLRQEKFDAVLTDPIWVCGLIVAEDLGIPSVNFLRGLPCTYDYVSAQCDSPLSYVPRLFTKNSDNMTFIQRVENVLVKLVENYYCDAIFQEFESLASHFLNRKITVLDLFSKSSIWLLRYDFIFEYPRPIMPNMIFVGGINCAVKNTLPKEFEKLVNSSGEHGFVVFSLGSMVSEIPMHKAMDIAEALRFLPQTVIWRYTGQAPSNLGENTHLVKWLPQNDLLAHPKARAFITHAGSHGIYEGICNAVPMVMLPLFGDQMDNAKRIESRGAGITLNVLDFTPEDLSNALTSVISIPSYKENIVRLSALHLDRPIHPLDLAVHWVEFVMRHKGAPHLRPAAHDLNWIQYHSIDVFAFLFAVLIISLFIGIKCCACTYRCCCRRKSPKGKSKSKKE